MEDHNLPRPGDPRLAEPPALEFICASQLSLVDGSDVQSLAPGRRVVLQIEPGGRIEGPRLKGWFLPGGLFTQLARADRVVEVDGRYLIETDDGHRIASRSRALISLAPNVEAELARGESYDPATLYARAAILFEAAEGSPYSWLNRGLFIVRSEWTGTRKFSTVWRVL